MLGGRVAVISGGLGDIGRAIGREMARNGAAVAIGDLSEQAVGAAELASAGWDGVPVRYDRVDVSDGAAVAEWLARVESDLGVPDLIVPNAAQVTAKGALSITAAEWERELAVNLSGAFHLARSAAARLLAARRPGRIVFVGSWAGHVPHPHIPAYSVAKAGLRMLCRCMALELAPHDILVNEVAPGYVDAGLSGRMFDADPALRIRSEAVVPVRRLIEPEDVAREVLHLCDPAVRHLVGSVVLMDGGLSLRSPAEPADA
jgi:NAD(P)-dependent dehydrogenase (short-subunit alcohol dehydrogenase family)